MAEPYLKDIDFAFFAVRFGYSKSDYEELTNREKAFLYKAYEDKVISDGYNMYNAMFTAAYNANRPKRKKALKLWRKAKTQKADMETVKNNMAIAREVEEKEGRGWVGLVYRKNGLKPPGRRRNG